MELSGIGYPRVQLLVGGRWLGEGRDHIAVRNPATDEVLGELPMATEDDVDHAALAAAAAFAAWRGTTAHERGAILRRVAALLRERQEVLARVLTLEQGKPLSDARLEIAACAEVFEWMAEEAPRVGGRIIPSRDPLIEQAVYYEPIGPVAAFTPWNFPAVLAVRKIAPALASGCAVVIKPPEETPATVAMIGRLCMDAGVPPGVLSILYGSPDMISARLIENSGIRKVTFTGSVAVGRIVGASAGRALKKVTLELGGHAPVVVCDDADAERAAVLGASRKFRNAGQYCHCPTRFLVHESLYASFLERFVLAAKAVTVGNGLDDAVQMGPLISKRRVAAMQALCEDAVSKGARVRLGGKVHPSARRGNFWEPTVLTDLHKDVAAMKEEPFGPIALIQPFSSLDEAVSMANDVSVGLCAYAFTRSTETTRRLRRELDAGVIAFNTFQVTATELPFGGVKDSGVGYEMGAEGLREYYRLKTVVQG